MKRQRKRKIRGEKKLTTPQQADPPLAGAAFTHFIPFAKKTGAIVTGDLLPR